jgi:hypothetical protein
MKGLKEALVLGLGVGFSVILGVRLIPFNGVNWGKIETLPGSTITVTGEARMESLPQIAHFSVSVSEFADDRDTAVNQVNTVMAQLIESVKEFGIAVEDIQTQQVSVYEVNDGGPEILIYPPRPNARNGWQASNSIEITLRDIDQASAIADLLQGSGATGVSGPNFTMENTDDLDTQLLEEAVADAREKAEVIAKASGRRLGKVITVSESGASVPYYRVMESSVAMDAAAPTPIEPGSQTTYKTVTVLFELR